MSITAGTVELHGHRGARGLRPENTLPGFAHALAVGVDAIELDVGMTADGVLVLNHDQTLSPVNLRDTAPAEPGDPMFPYVGRYIRELTYAQVRTVDAGTRVPQGDDDDLARTQVPLPGTPLPTLAEACALLVTAPRVRVSVELKTDPGWPAGEVTRFTAAVAEVLAAFDLTDRSRILAFDWRVLAEARRYAPEAGRVALFDRRTAVPDTSWFGGLPAADPVGAALDSGATLLSPEWNLVGPELVRRSHGMALPVAVWTLNDPADMVRHLDYGVDAIVTDYPDRLRTVLADHGLPLPEPWTVTSPIPT